MSENRLLSQQYIQHGPEALVTVKRLEIPHFSTTQRQILRVRACRPDTHFHDLPDKIQHHLPKRKASFKKQL